MWKPVLRQDTRQNKDLEQDDDSKKSHLVLGCVLLFYHRPITVIDRLNSREPTRGAPVHPAAAAILARQTKRRML
jgi:hypothetical protein